MLILLGISTAASLVASAVLGVRLLRLARRTRQAPELLMGTAFLGAGVVGYVLMLIGTAPGEVLPAGTARLCFEIGYAAISGGVILNVLFVWRVFRPGSRVARVFVGLLCPVIAVTGLPFALPADGVAEAASGELSLAVFWLGHGVRITSGAWGSLEAARTHVALRRRLRLALADPVVANRVALFGLASLGSVLIFGSTAFANAPGASPGEVMSPGQILLISSVTLAVAVCQWLAFLPPRRYREWLNHRAGQAGS